MYYVKPIFIFNSIIKYYNILLIYTLRLSDFARNKKITKCCLFILAILSIVILSSCSVKGYKTVSNSNNINIAEIQIFDDNFEKALYKTNIVIYNNNLTGITVIKKIDSSIRVVSISEMGMKYFDFEFPNNQQYEPIVHYIMEPLNKKLLINMIKKDFGLLFYIPDINNSQVMVNIEDESKILIKHNKLLYFSDNTGVISQIKKQRILLPNNTIITLLQSTQSYPDTIDINHYKISLNFEAIK